MQIDKNFIQNHPFPARDVFPLLCPVREKDWLPGWDYTMIHSHSGLIEQDCVFSTPQHADLDTLWKVYHYNRDQYEVGFVRHSPGKNMVRIFIKVVQQQQGSQSVIRYIYTPLSKEEEDYINRGLDDDFQSNMITWEKCINYYLETGSMMSE